MTYSDPEGGNEQTVEYEPYSAEDRIHWFDDIVLENPTCRYGKTISLQVSEAQSGYDLYNYVRAAVMEYDSSLIWSGNLLFSFEKSYPSKKEYDRHNSESALSAIELAENTTYYMTWCEWIDTINITVDPPVAGSEVTERKIVLPDGTSETVQTNSPHVVQSAETADKVKVDAWWCVSMDADYHYEGTIEDGEEYYILLNLNPYFGYTVSRRTKIVMNREGNYYGFTRNVSSIQLADTITATFHYGPGWTVTNSYSVADYVQDFEEEKEDHNDATVNLVYALADYGHFVQPMLANARGWVPGKDHAVMPGHTESYSDDEITNATEAVSRFAAKFNAAGSSINVTSMYLALDSSTTLVLKLTPADGYMGDVTYSVDGGTPENAAVLDDGRFKIALPDITAPRLGQAYSIRIQASGEDSLEVSPLSYADTVLKSEKYSNDEDMRNAIVALYYYYSAAQGF